MLNNLPGSVIKVLPSEAECRAYLTCSQLNQSGFSCSPLLSAKRNRGIPPAMARIISCLWACSRNHISWNTLHQWTEEKDCPHCCCCGALAFVLMRRVEAFICGSCAGVLWESEPHAYLGFCAQPRVVSNASIQRSLMSKCHKL